MVGCSLPSVKEASNSFGTLPPKKVLATSSGVRPCLFLMLGSACASTRRRARPTSPRFAAKCKGVASASIANSSTAVPCGNFPASRAAVSMATIAGFCGRQRLLTLQPFSRRKSTASPLMFSFEERRHKSVCSPPQYLRKPMEALASSSVRRTSLTSAEPTTAHRHVALRPMPGSTRSISQVGKRRSHAVMLGRLPLQHAEKSASMPLNVVFLGSAPASIRASHVSHLPKTIAPTRGVAPFIM
mmetsp:Transcript_128019/g.398646  ORF Transcript_128019/g.398646 Transcript_128019/m.398646 type:complete len:243 (-) Transcript_128019:273-1001(-)